MPASASSPHGSRADFWQARLQKLGTRRPVNVMSAVRGLIGAPSVEVTKTDWADVHSRIGVELPSDYREFIDSYGPGTVGDIQIAAPSGPGELNLFTLLERKYNQIRRLSRNSTQDAPFYPEAGGTICWGETTGGWTCAWAPTGVDPDEWNVVAIMPTANLRGHKFRAGYSFSMMLNDHIEQEPIMHGMVPRRPPSASPVTFVPAGS
jgi:hypothetical protein